MEDKGFSPAALGAALKGDFENMMVAMTPGGIEAQEHQGQSDFVVSDSLPKQGLEDGVKQKLESMGFIFGADIDELFVLCKLPDGWYKKADDHNMHSYLIDNKGGKRAHIFYKAAFYDRRARITISCRFQFSGHHIPEDDRAIPVEDRKEVLTIIDNSNGIIMWQSDVYKMMDNEAENQCAKERKEWIKNIYPDYEDPFAYWD